MRLKEDRLPEVIRWVSTERLKPTSVYSKELTFDPYALVIFMLELLVY